MIDRCPLLALSVEADLPCVLDHGHKGPCLAEAPRAASPEDATPCSICRRVHADWRTAHACE